MATPVSTNETWRFGVYEVDTRRVELRRDGKPVKMREQSFLILVYLLENAGEIVTREELCRVLWPSDTYVDFDHSLSMAVMNLRDTLGDSTDAPLYIETIPKRGYRFIAPVTTAVDFRNGLAHSNGDSAAPPLNGTNGAQQIAPTPAETPIRHRRRGLAAAAIGLILLAAVGSLVFLHTHRSATRLANGNQAFSAFQIVPLTTAPGEAGSLVFSPDGREIAYLWDGPERRHFDAYVQLVGSDTPLRLTSNKSGFLGPPAWSPDGREIAFSRCDGKNDGVYVVPALGGAERELTHVGCPDAQPKPLAWISDGQEMLMIDHCSTARPFGVVLFSLATGKKQCLTNSGPAGFHSVDQFSLSPDGRTIAFTTPTDSSYCEIYTMPLSGGAPLLLTADGHSCIEFMWTPDSQSIVFLSQRTTLPSLWMTPANGGPAQHEATYPALGSFSMDGRRLVYSETTSGEPAAIWRADLAAAEGAILDNRKLIQTQFWESAAQPSPDGSRIVWMSFRTGFGEIWMNGATGGSPLQLTHLSTLSGTPRWSPDGKWIVFDSVIGGSRQVLVVDAEGRNQHAITDGPYDNGVPSWSRDGKSIYFASMRTGSWQVWKHSLDSGAELQLTEYGGFDPFESQDGRTIYFSRYDQAGIWSIPVGGGTESLVVANKPQYGYWGCWAVTGTGLYLFNLDAEPRPRIEFYDFATHRTSPVLTLEKKLPRWHANLSATADGRRVYYAQFDQQSVIKMMEIAH